MRTGKAMKHGGSFHVKRRRAHMEFDRLYLEALGRCVHAARAARRAALIATLAIAAIGCGYSEMEMQAMRDKVEQLKSAAITLSVELEKPCVRPVGPQ